MQTTNSKHVFLCPLKNADENFISYILKVAEYSPERFSYILSFPGEPLQENLIKKINNSCNVYLNINNTEFSRCEHWQLLPQVIEKYTGHSTFSYLFMGDEIFLETFPHETLISGQDFYLNEYFLDDVQNVKSPLKLINFLDDNKKISKVNFLIGKPCYSPLQKIIFNKRVIGDIKFDPKMPFVSDQTMVHELISSGCSFEFISCPFYKLNQKNRSYEKTLSFSEKIRSQIYLYLKVRCYFGIPMVLIRTFLKKIGEIL